MMYCADQRGGSTLCRFPGKKNKKVRRLMRLKSLKRPNSDRGATKIDNNICSKHA